MPALPVLPATEPGSFLVLPLPMDLGGLPGTAAGAVWLAERLKSAEVASLVETSYQIVPPIVCEAPFGRLEPSLYAAAVTLQAWRSGFRPLWLFGDHGLSYGPVRAAGMFERRITAFVFDAHFDRLNALLKRMGRTCGMENEVHQGNVATFIGRDPQVRKLVQIGVRQPVGAGELDPLPAVDVLPAAEILQDIGRAALWVDRQVREAAEMGDLIVLSVDFDVIDPAQLPAVDHRVPVGLSVAQALRLVGLVAASACCIDLVELNPLRDENGRGCRAALGLLCGMLASLPPRLGRDSWIDVLGTAAPKPLLALGPFANQIVRGDCWLDPSPVESAILSGLAVEELAATFTGEALRAGVKAVRSAASAKSAASVPVALTTPAAITKLTRQAPSGEPHVECISVSNGYRWMARAGWDRGVYLSRLCKCNSEPIRLSGHTKWVVAAAFAPADQRLATVSDDQTLRIWPLDDDAPCHTEPLVCHGHDSWVKAVGWSPDGQRVASAGFDGSLVIWNSRTGEKLKSLQAHPDSIWNVNWSADGSILTTCGERGFLRVWHGETIEPIRECLGHAGPIERCKFDANGSLWSLSRFGRLVLHDSAEEEPTAVISTPFEQTLDLGMLNNPVRILVAGPRSVHVVSAQSRGAIANLEADFPIQAIAAAGRDEVAIAGDGGSIYFYDVPRN
ncbi:MAG TPA: arginase family protein [Bryobacteraceae bacterium]|nr:arginase family protein [Bryobacteraceae bacterium]